MTHLNTMSFPHLYTQYTLITSQDYAILPCLNFLPFFNTSSYHAHHSSSRDILNVQFYDDHRYLLAQQPHCLEVIDLQKGCRYRFNISIGQNMLKYHIIRANILYVLVLHIVRGGANTFVYVHELQKHYHRLFINSVCIDRQLVDDLLADPSLIHFGVLNNSHVLYLIETVCKQNYQVQISFYLITFGNVDSQQRVQISIDSLQGSNCRLVDRKQVSCSRCKVSVDHRSMAETKLSIVSCVAVLENGFILKLYQLRQQGRNIHCIKVLEEFVTLSLPISIQTQMAYSIFRAELTLILYNRSALLAVPQLQYMFICKTGISEQNKIVCNWFVLYHTNAIKQLLFVNQNHILVLSACRSLNGNNVRHQIHEYNLLQYQNSISIIEPSLAFRQQYKECQEMSMQVRNISLQQEICHIFLLNVQNDGYQLGYLYQKLVFNELGTKENGEWSSDTQTSIFMSVQPSQYSQSNYIDGLNPVQGHQHNHLQQALQQNYLDILTNQLNLPSIIADVTRPTISRILVAFKKFNTVLTVNPTSTNMQYLRKVQDILIIKLCQQLQAITAVCVGQFWNSDSNLFCFKMAQILLYATHQQYRQVIQLVSNPISCIADMNQIILQSLYKIFCENNMYQLLREYTGKYKRYTQLFTYLFKQQLSCHHMKLNRTLRELKMSHRVNIHFPISEKQSLPSLSESELFPQNHDSIQCEQQKGMRVDELRQQCADISIIEQYQCNHCEIAEERRVLIQNSFFKRQNSYFARPLSDCNVMKFRNDIIQLKNVHIDSCKSIKIDRLLIQVEQLYQKTKTQILKASPNLSKQNVDAIKQLQSLIIQIVGENLHQKLQQEINNYTSVFWSCTTRKQVVQLLKYLRGLIYLVAQGQSQQSIQFDLLIEANHLEVRSRLYNKKAEITTILLRNQSQFRHKQWQIILDKMNKCKAFIDKQN